MDHRRGERPIGTAAPRSVAAASAVGDGGVGAPGRGDPGGRDPGGGAEPARRPRGPDRRRKPTSRLSRFAFGAGRRRAARRADERHGAFVDVYDPRLLLLAGWVALMNVADSGFTLVHLQAGGRELNPVADAMLMTGRLGFVALKSALIGIALIVLCLHVNFPLARIGLWLAALAYTLLVVYHLTLFGVG